MNSRWVFALLSIAAVPGSLGWTACSSHSDSPDAGGDGGGRGDVGAESAHDGGSASESSRGWDAGPPPCLSDGGFPRPSAVPAFGTLTGPDLSADICSRGAFAYLERTTGSRTTPSQLLLIINTALSGNPTDFIHFKTPANATGGDLTILAGVSRAAPGTYPSSGACGGDAFCVYLPVPSSVYCGDAAAPTTCPPGCSLMGPVSGPTCMPTTPEDCYAAMASGNCVYGTQSQQGSWTLTLFSVVPYGGGDGGPGTDYVVHGTFTSTMIGSTFGMTGDDAALGTATISLRF